MSLSTLFDLLFPARCVGCNSLGSVFCTTCLLALPVFDPACLVCNARNRNGTICNSCRRRLPYLTRAFWATSYTAESIRMAIMHFKYHGNRAFAEPLTTCIVTFLKKHAQGNTLPLPTDAVLLPVPLHPRKKRERGFNQAELLAIAFARELQLPMLSPSVLNRARYTMPQAQVRGWENRVKNVDQAFVVPHANESLVHNKTIILVDDIATTGNTLNAAAQALKEAGAKRVWGLVVAKG